MRNPKPDRNTPAWVSDWLAPKLESLRPNNLPTVFVVEDDADIARGLRYMLSNAYEIRTAPGSREALEALGRGLPDLLLVDYRLPDMNGIEFMHELRARGARLPAIMLSAYGNRREESLEAGFAAFIQKPWDNRELVWRIESALRSSG